jgi:SpoVK/Ycf46/Vps4 family AAA+-type ATPase
MSPSMNTASYPLPFVAQAPILALVNQFQEKKGKFGIAGYPQKLGFLLYGPPGTGKVRLGLQDYG